MEKKYNLPEANEGAKPWSKHYDQLPFCQLTGKYHVSKVAY